jgi:hypothetical protein
MKPTRDNIKSLIVVSAIVGIGVIAPFVYTGRAGGDHGAGCGGELAAEDLVTPGGENDPFPSTNRPKPTIVSPKSGDVFLLATEATPTTTSAAVSFAIKFNGAEDAQVKPTYSLWRLAEDETGLLQTFPYEPPAGSELPSLMAKPKHPDLLSVQLELPAGQYRISAELQYFVTQQDTVTAYRLTTRNIDFSVEAKELAAERDNNTPTISAPTPQDGDDG